MSSNSRESAAYIVFTSMLLLLAISVCGIATDDPDVRFKFRELARKYDVSADTPTFGYIVLDVNNDGLDDIFGSHHGNAPVLYINKKGRFFENVIDLLPLAEETDIHSPCAADFDKDGDTDLIFAGGGEGYNASRAGTPNQFFRNNLIETGELSFDRLDVGFEFQPWRTRAIIPHPSADGSEVNLLMQAIPAKNGDKPHQYLINVTQENEILFKVKNNDGISDVSHSEGDTVFTDIDKDGDYDFLTIESTELNLYEFKKNKYRLDEDLFAVSQQVETVTVADLDNNGFLDVIIGGRVKVSGNDALIWDESSIEFSLASGIIEEVHTSGNNVKGDKTDRFSFTTLSDSIEIRFGDGSEESGAPTAAFFIGRKSDQLNSAQTVITAGSARGKPQVAKNGVNIWFEDGRWYIEIRYGKEGGELAGIITATGIADLINYNLELKEAEPVHDIILMNKGDMTFSELEVPELEHSKITTSISAVDVDNDGFVDLVILRRGFYLYDNGHPEVVRNLGPDDNGDLKFVVADVPSLIRKDSDFYSAESLVAGFFNNDYYFDFVATNGQGRAPNRGPVHLFINKMKRSNSAVILNLVGTVSNTDALGAKVELYDSSGTLLGYREVFYKGRNQMNASRVHFGLGDPKTIAEPLKAIIHWPSGKRKKVIVKPDTEQIVRETKK